MRQCGFYADRALCRDVRRKLELWLDPALLHTLWDPTWNQWKHLLGTKIEVDATFVQSGKYRSGDAWKWVCWDGRGSSKCGRQARKRGKSNSIASSGSMTVPGLQKPASVLRDRWGVAQSIAKNQRDLFFAQGFVAAQDRLFQMEPWRRSEQGRLAEVPGSSALFRDINARLLSYHGDMAAEYASYAPDTKEILEAFTDGINAFIATRSQPNGPGLPIESSGQASNLTPGNPRTASTAWRHFR